MSGAGRPEPAAVRAYQFPGLHRHRLANGLGVVVAPMHRLPIVTAMALVDAGAVEDPAGMEGLAALTARTLDEGTGALDGAALTELFESMGTAFEASADWDSSVARISVMPQHLDAAFARFAEVLRAPGFPARDVDRRRDERLDDLAQALAEPRGLADMRFVGCLYDHAARYARPAAGTSGSVAALDAPAVRAFHAARYRPAATTLVMVGDITAEAALRLVEARLGDWTGAPLPAAAPDARSTASTAAPDAVRQGRRSVLIAKPGAAQSELRIGHRGVPRAHVGYLPIVVMNAILGGLFSSRINLNLRERNAFTYGASSGFDWRRGAGPFVVSTAVQSDVTDRAVREVLRELEAMRELPPSASELSLATDYLAGVFPIRYETTAAVAGAIGGAIVYGLPDDWFETYRDRVQAVTAADVHAAARAAIDPAALLVLAVGDADAVAKPLAALGHGSWEVRAAADDPAAGESTPHAPGTASTPSTPSTLTRERREHP